MRNAFAQELVQRAAADERVVLLMGDIGNHLFDVFKTRFPDRFYNCGVAEANMMSVAAGMALCGLRPVVYTIVPFVTTRCLEQIRVDVCYHRAPVTIVGVGGGLSYASLGATHHSCEDIAFLRVLPHMQVVCPGDAQEVRLGLRRALEQDDPVYLRIGKKGEPVIHATEPAFEIGKGLVLRSGHQITVLSTGNLLPTAVAVAERLELQGRSVRLISLHTVKPLDEDLLRVSCATSQVVVTLEEHSLLGGLGGAVAEWLADHGPFPAKLLRIGTADHFLHETGGQTHARRCEGLDV
ncbi:MAG: transketolase, partial [Planctomycetota bacterium]|nr:transketolase [Planctomycetota bacterium]